MDDNLALDVLKARTLEHAPEHRRAFYTSFTLGGTQAGLVIATADGHPRAISYTSWVPAPTAAAITRHAFFRQLMAAQHGRRSAPAQQAAARLDARGMDIGWVIAWRQLRPAVSKYLAASATGPTASPSTTPPGAPRHPAKPDDPQQ